MNLHVMGTLRLGIYDPFKLKGREGEENRVELISPKLIYSQLTLLYSLLPSPSIQTGATMQTTRIMV